MRAAVKVGWLPAVSWLEFETALTDPAAWSLASSGTRGFTRLYPSDTVSPAAGVPVIATIVTFVTRV